MRSVILVAATFVACALEMVEALTIVLVAAITRGWDSVRLGIVGVLAFDAALAFGQVGQLRRRARSFAAGSA